jgi:flagellar motor switch protein FliN/FliY
MTLADTDTPDGESGDSQFQEAVQLPGGVVPAPPGIDDPIDLGRRTAVREAQFRSVTVEVSVWIGKTRRTFGDLAKLRPGDVIELDRAVGAPVDIVLNREVVIARGEVVDVGDEYGVRITEIVSDEDG